MKKSILLIPVFILAACTSVPNVTVTSEVTVTLTPSPIPTPTLHPEFTALQNEINTSSGRFSLQADGLIYDGGTPIPGMTVAPDGTMTLTVNGETVTLDPADVDFDDEKGISIKGYKWDKTANDGAGAWVEAEPIKEYPVCITENFRDCEIGEVDDLFNGNYLAHLRTLSQPFDPEKFKDPMPGMIITSNGTMIYDVASAPNFEDPETAPFRRNVTAGVVYGSDGRMYMVLPIEYPDPSDPTNPEKNVWVIGIRNLFNPRNGEAIPESSIQSDINIWLNNMNIAPIRTGLANPNSGTIDELAKITWDTHPDMEERFEAFRNGDTTALDGLVVELSVTTTSDQWYE